MSDRPAQDNYTRPSPTNWAQKPIRCPRVGMNTVPVLLLFAAASMSARFKSENKIADLPVEPELPSVVSTPRVHWRAILGIGRGIANARAPLRFFVAQRKIMQKSTAGGRKCSQLFPSSARAALCQVSGPRLSRLEQCATVPSHHARD